MLGELYIFIGINNSKTKSIYFGSKPNYLQFYFDIQMKFLKILQV